MNLAEIMPPTPADVADWTDIYALQKRMAETVSALSGLANSVGMARQVQAYDSDRRKRALARAMAAALAAGESVAKAEAEGRASDNYAKEMNQLKIELGEAEKVTAQYDVLKIVWSSCQSLLAIQREAVKRL